MFHKRIEVAIRAFNRTAPAAGRRGGRSRDATPAPARGADDHASRAEGPGRARRRVDGGRAPRRWSSRRRRSSGSPPSRPRRRGGPVIALEEGGACENVVEGETGAFYERSDPARAGERRWRRSTRWRSIRRTASKQARRLGIPPFQAAAAGDRRPGGGGRAPAAPRRSPRGRHRLLPVARCDAPLRLTVASRARRAPGLQAPATMLRRG